MLVSDGVLGWLCVVSVLTLAVGQAPVTTPGRMSSATRAMIKAQMRSLLSGKRGFIPILSYLRVRGGSIRSVSPVKSPQTTKKPGTTIPVHPVQNGAPGAKYRWMYVVPNENRWLSRIPPISGQETGYGEASLPGTGTSPGVKSVSVLPVTRPTSSATTVPPRGPVSVYRDPTEANGGEPGDTSRTVVLRPEAGDPLTQEYGDKTGNAVSGGISVRVNSTHVRHETGDSGLNRDAQPIAIGPATQGVLVLVPRGARTGQNEPGRQGTSARRINTGLEPEARDTGLNVDIAPRGSGSGRSVVSQRENGQDKGGALAPEEPVLRTGHVTMASGAGESTRSATNGQQGSGNVGGVGTTSGMNNQFPSETIHWLSRGKPGNVPAFYARVNSPDVQNPQIITTNAFKVAGSTVNMVPVTAPPGADYTQYSTVYIGDVIVPATTKRTGPQNGQTVETPGPPTANGVVVLTDQNPTSVPAEGSSTSKVLLLYTGHLNHPTSANTRDTTPSTTSTQFAATSAVNNPAEAFASQVLSQWDSTTSLQNPSFTVQALAVSKAPVQGKFNGRTNPLAVSPDGLYTAAASAPDWTSPPPSMPSTMQQKITTSQRRRTTANRNSYSAVKATTGHLSSMPTTPGQRKNSLAPKISTAEAVVITTSGLQGATDLQGVPQTAGKSTPDSLMAPPLIGPDGQSLPNPGITTSDYNTVSGTNAQVSYPYETTTPLGYSTEVVTSTNSSNVTTPSPYGGLNDLCGPHLGGKDFPSTTTSAVSVSTPRYRFPWLNPAHPEYEPPEPSEPPEPEMLAATGGGAVVLTPGMCFCSEKPECEGLGVTRGLPYEYQCDVKAGLTCCCEPG